MDQVYRDRTEAGRLLGDAVRAHLGPSPAIVLGLPRGGVPLAVLVGRALGAPVDVLVVRKVGVPGRPELAMGAVAAGVTIRNEDVLAMLPQAAAAFDKVAAEQRAEVCRREHAYRSGRPPLALENSTVVLVDDGVATGATLRAAIAAVRRLRAARVVVAAPVASEQALQALEGEADDVVCLQVPSPFTAVGEWYEAFPQVTDDEVREWMEAAPAP